MKIGVIGFGSRIQSMLQEMMRLDQRVSIAAIVDIRLDQIKEQIAASGKPLPALYSSVEEMLANEKLDGIAIGTRCSLHATYAQQVLHTGIPLFMEKPVATIESDLIALKKAYEQNRTEVVVSFPLRLSPLVQLAKEIIDSGKIGTIEHVQAVNNVPYGSVYFQNWYRDENETRGLFLQKATHDFDYINYLLKLHPVTICAMKSKQIFKGNKPAGLTCEACAEKRTCQESAFLKRLQNEKPEGDYCAFAEDTGNEDSGTAIVRYESGMHVSYSQNFFARRAAEARGARLLGYKGTLEFDFYTSKLQVYLHHTPRVETYEINTNNMVHSGGDTELANNFIQVMDGTDSSRSPLDAGLLSALMCFRATESSETDTFQSIKWKPE
jgi:predicted dehydrogenase